MKSHSFPIVRSSTFAFMLATGCAGGNAQQVPAAPAAPAVPAAVPAPAPAVDETATKLTGALAGAHRSEKNRARDVYRHPLETLSFFGLKDNMTVVELSPGGGWYTEVLAPVLKDRGKLIVTSGDPATNKGAKEFQDRLAKTPEVFGNVQYVVWGPPAKVELGAPNSVDMVLTFRSIHGWIGGKNADKVLKGAFDVLKPGGVLGLSEHRANPGMDVKTGYVEESVVIELATAAGFKLDQKSEVNANPKDTKDHPDGVWTLLPSLRQGEKDKEKYMAIGESDRMTLRFVKPAN